MKKCLFALFSVVSFISMISCNNALAGNLSEVSEVLVESDLSDSARASSSTGYDESVFQKYEAEAASYGSLPTGTDSSASYVLLKGSGDGTITFSVSASTSTQAYLNIRAKGCGGEKTNTVLLNGSSIGTFVSPSEQWDTTYVETITLNAGTNTIMIAPWWGWIYVDYIELVSPYESEAGSESDSTSGSTETTLSQIYEAEVASYGDLSTGYDGSVSYVLLKGSSDGTISFNVSASASTQAYLNVKAKGCGGEKINTVLLNGSSIGTFVTPAEQWDITYVATVTLNAGTNTIVISPYWGWIYVDYIELVTFGGNTTSDDTTSDSTSDGTTINYSFVTTPCNANASTAAKNLMAEIGSNYGKKIITGQMDLTWNDSVDMDARVYNDTGKHPKLMGYDFLNYLDYQYGSGLSQVEEAIAWHNLGGYVTFCWHWRVTGSNGYNNFYSTSSSWDGTDFTIPYSNGSWNTSSSYYTQLINDMDTIAGYLKTLQEAGVPVLWRPLHEAAGGWFWWGNSGSEAFIALWKLMYERFTSYHGLNNLIWVWNGQSKSYYPGDDYVDIIGVDYYASARDYSSYSSKYYEAVNYCDNPGSAPKMVALTENGTIPSPDNCYADGAMWAWFMTWNDSNGSEGVSDSSSFWTGEYYNENWHKTEVYSSSYVITR